MLYKAREAQDSSDLMSSSGHMEFDSIRAMFRWLGKATEPQLSLSVVCHQRGHSCRRRWAAGISSNRNQISFDHRIAELSDSPMTFEASISCVSLCISSYIIHLQRYEDVNVQ